MALIIASIIRIDSSVKISALVDVQQDVDMLLEIVDSLVCLHFNEDIKSKELLADSMGTDGVRSNYQILLEQKGSVGVWYFNNDNRGIMLTQA